MGLSTSAFDAFLYCSLDTQFHDHNSIDCLTLHVSEDTMSQEAGPFTKS